MEFNHENEVAHLDILVCHIYYIIEQLLKNSKLSDAICIFAALDNTLSTASGQKYTTKLTCTKCDIYCVSAKLGSKKVIGIFKYLKYFVLAITFVKIFEI